MIRLHLSLLSYIFGGVLLQIPSQFSKEVYINSNEIPSYLYRKFEKVEEELFPMDIIVNVSFSNFQGTLLYSMDKNMHQLIMTLVADELYSLEVQLNQQRFAVSLRSLCGCHWCLYQPLYLRIQLGYHIKLQCNYQQIQNTVNERKTELHNSYPIMYSPITSKKLLNNEAHMWLVNHQEYSKVYPNPDQMRGCIFKTIYNDQEVIFTSITKNIVQECKPTCTGTICNGGQCYETYNKVPICNCTTTFKNGENCNDSIVSQNIRINSMNYIFEMIKISWNSNVKKLLEMNNSQIRITIRIEDKNLFIEYTYGDKRPLLYKAIMTDNYEPNTDYVAVIQFNVNEIDIRLLHNQSWNRITMKIQGEIGKERISDLELRSDTGVIDIVYKFNSNYAWSKIPKKNYFNLSNDIISKPFQNITTTATAGLSESRAATITVPIISSFLIIAAVIVIIFFRRRIRRKLYKMKRNKEMPISSPAYECLPSNSQHNMNGNEGPLLTNNPMMDDHIDSAKPYDLGDIEDLLSKDTESNTKLHLSSRLLMHGTCSELIVRGVDVNSINNRGYSPLLEMLHHHRCNVGHQEREEDLIKTMKVLIDSGAKTESADHDIIEMTTRCNSEKLLSVLLKGDEQLKSIEGKHLLKWFELHYFDTLKQLFGRLQEKVVKQLLTADVIIQSLEYSDMNLTLDMLDYTDKSVHDSVIDKVLYKAAKIDDEESFLKLINTDISKVGLLDNRETLLGSLIKERKIKYCRMLLGSDYVLLLVEQRNMHHKLPLHICIESNVQDLIDDLIIDTQSVDDEDSRGYTPLALLFERISNGTGEDNAARTMIHIKTLINKEADIYKVNSSNRLIISFCSDKTKKAEIEAFYKRSRPSQTPKCQKIICRTCRSNGVDCVLECGHVYCMSCGKSMEACEICSHKPTNAKHLLI